MSNSTYEVTFPYEGKEFSFLGPDSHILRGMEKYQRFYEMAFLEFLREHVPSGGVWVDAGAFIGTHSVYFAEFCADEVHAFEPNETNFAYLQENTADYGNITLYNSGLWYEKVQINGWQLYRLDKYNLPDVQCIKIDTEGAEVNILEGAVHTLEDWRPWLGLEAQEVGCYARQYSFLYPLGYQRFGKRFNRTPTFVWKPRIS